MIIAILLLSVLAQIPLNKNLLISLEEDRNHYITVRDKEVRAIKVMRTVFNENDMNVCKIMMINDKFIIKYGFKFLFQSITSTRLMAKEFSENDPGFLFDIVETRKGFMIISQDNLCLTVSDLISETEGNFIETLECDQSSNQIFLIRNLSLNNKSYENMRISKSRRSYSNKNMNFFKKSSYELI
ncbi:hypothetical protein H312_00441 [Anncaliia algerae PRA339]|uniref:Ricin B lectin domain-containing protein n=1 Tax=Anncaliia algerae PRA339 TaxID=1288291 RepID=A0A059F5A6_9MICR|nr:hypothetical protein H312_00441 [Anncaliia algerae PRA339]